MLTVSIEDSWASKVRCAEAPTKNQRTSKWMKKKFSRKMRVSGVKVTTFPQQWHQTTMMLSLVQSRKQSTELFTTGHIQHLVLGSCKSPSHFT